MLWKKKLLAAGRLDGGLKQRLLDEFPAVELTVCGGDHDVIRAEIPDVEIVYGRINREEYLASRKLKWIHNNYVGVESMCFAELAESSVLVTNSRGVHSRPMAEHILAMVLALYRNLPAMWALQQRHEWKPIARERFSTLTGKTIGFLGTGSIGALAASLFKPLGCRVIGYNGHGQNVDPFETIYTGTGLGAMLAESDVVVNTLPHTPMTRGLMNEERFGQMKHGAVFINVGRGATVDEPALIRALEQGKVGAAGLDVFAVEPLPAESPLWGMPNVIICPHQSGDDPANLAHVFESFLENLRRYCDGRPLLNRVNLHDGY